MRQTSRDPSPVPITAILTGLGASSSSDALNSTAIHFRGSWQYNLASQLTQTSNKQKEEKEGEEEEEEGKVASNAEMEVRVLNKRGKQE